MILVESVAVSYTAVILIEYVVVSCAVELTYLE